MADEEILKRLDREVMQAERGSSLPSALSDEWLQLASNSIEGMFGSDAETDTSDGVGLALVLKTLSDKRQEERLKIPIDEMHDYLETYLVELSIEILNRTTEFKSNPASLETIFEPDRKVNFRLRPE